jgi:hypothetical protein
VVSPSRDGEIGVARGDGPEDTLVVVCSCSSLDHVIRFARFIDDKDIAYVDVVLARRGFWHRLATAWRCVLNKTCRFGSVAEVVFDAEGIERLRQWCVRAQEGSK